MLAEELLARPHDVRGGADALGGGRDDLADRLHRPDAVEDAGLPGLDAAHDPLGDVAGVDDLHPVVGRSRTEDRAGLGQPLGPVRVATRRVARADDQPGPDHHRPRGAVEHQSLAGDLHAAVRLRVLAQVAVLLDRLDQRAVGAGVGRLVVAVDVHRRHEHPVRGRPRGHGLPYVRRDARDVDDGVELLARELGGYVVGAVPDHVPRPVGHVARPAARHARDLVPARHRVRRRRLGEEHAAAEHQDPHADTRPCRLPQGQAVPLRADSAHH